METNLKFEEEIRTKEREARESMQPIIDACREIQRRSISIASGKVKRTVKSDRDGSVTQSTHPQPSSSNKESSNGSETNKSSSQQLSVSTTLEKNLTANDNKLQREKSRKTPQNRSITTSSEKSGTTLKSEGFEKNSLHSKPLTSDKMRPKDSKSSKVTSKQSTMSSPSTMIRTLSANDTVVKQPRKKSADDIKFGREDAKIKAPIDAKRRGSITPQTSQKKKVQETR